MERKRKRNVYKKFGGGISRINGRIIKPGQTFDAYPEEIPKAFNDVIKLIKDNESKQVKKESEQAAKFTIQSRGQGWYDVVNAAGKVQNENALREDEAVELKKALEG